MENLTSIHHHLLNAGVSGKRARLLGDEIRDLVVVCIAALRASHLELWKREAADGRLSLIDPTLAHDQSPPPDRAAPPAPTSSSDPPQEPPPTTPDPSSTP